MKLVYCVSFVSAFLILCEGKASPTTGYTTTVYTATTASLNLKGKMVTLSQNSEVTFKQPRSGYLKVGPMKAATTMEPNTTAYMPITTDTPAPHAPPPKGVSVCLRFLADNSIVPLFKLNLDLELTFSLDNQRYSLATNWNTLSLNPMIAIWTSVQTQPWTSVCMILDFQKNMVQVFQGGSMSVRKRTRGAMKWSREAVLTVPGFDGQLKDLEVWDYPLENTEIFNFMQNYGSSGNVLTWSNIEYIGSIVVEDTYTFGLRQPISCREEVGQPIKSGKRRDQRRKNRKMLSGRRQRNRGMF